MFSNKMELGNILFKVSELANKKKSVIFGWDNL